MDYSGEFGPHSNSTPLRQGKTTQWTTPTTFFPPELDETAPSIGGKSVGVLLSDITALMLLSSAVDKFIEYRNESASHTQARRLLQAAYSAIDLLLQKLQEGSSQSSFIADADRQLFEQLRNSNILDNVLEWNASVGKAPEYSEASEGYRSYFRQHPEVAGGKACPVPPCDETNSLLSLNDCPDQIGENNSDATCDSGVATSPSTSSSCGDLTKQRALEPNLKKSLLELKLYFEDRLYSTMVANEYSMAGQEDEDVEHPGDTAEQDVYNEGAISPTWLELDNMKPKVHRLISKPVPLPHIKSAESSISEPDFGLSQISLTSPDTDCLMSTFGETCIDLSSSPEKAPAKVAKSKILCRRRKIEVPSQLKVTPFTRYLSINPLSYDSDDSQDGSAVGCWNVCWRGISGRFNRQTSA